MLRLFALCALLGALSLCTTGVALACPQLLGHSYPPHRFVGDVSDPLHGAECTDDSIQAAINNATGDPACPDKIYITGEHLYTSHFCDPNHNGSCQLNINGKSLQLIGWNGNGVHCGNAPANGCEVIHNCAGTSPGSVSLNGEDSTRVLTVTGSSNVSLSNVIVTHGFSSGNGGGISFDGAGSLSLDNSSVSQSAASSGGGINVNGSGAGATLTLGNNVLVLDNTASGSGGGVRITGATRLFALQPGSALFDNHALTAYGGGLQIVGPAQADIGSSGYLNAGVMFQNDAAYGGGIAVNTVTVTGNALTSAALRLFSTDPAKPVRISNNFASHTGGGIFLKPYAGTDDFQDSLLCASDFRIDNNVAQNGSAIYADLDHSVIGGDHGDLVYLNRNDEYGRCATPEPVSSLGAVPCTPGVSCNAIENNVAADQYGNPTDGATILIQNTGNLDANRFILRGNTGGHAIRGFDAPTTMANCLVVENTVSANLIQFENEGDYDYHTSGFEEISNCTLSGNLVGGSRVISSAHELTLSADIIYQAIVPTLSYTGASGYLTVDNILSNDTSTLPTAPDIVEGSATYENISASDYHLKTTSLGIDFAPAGDGIDLDGNPRTVDLSSIQNFNGARDLGAYERQNLFNECGTSDSLFCDGFER